MYEERNYNDYETNFCSANFSHSLEKEKHALRRKSSAFKKRNRKKAIANGSVGPFGYYLETEKPIYSGYFERVIEKHTVYTYYANGFVFTKEIPERRIRCRKLLGFQEVKPYLKRVDISSRRKYAKQRTNEKIRNEKFYLKDNISSSPSGYRKVHEYEYEIW